MPELPEIEINKQYLNATSLHEEIYDVDYGDEILFETSKQQIGKSCKGHSFSKTLRIGKYLLLQIDDGPWLCLHFGMTGSLKYYERNGEIPDYWGLIFHFKNHYSLAFICPRKFGKIDLFDSPEEFRKDKELGPDALDIDKDKFVEIFSEKRGMVKPALMDQKTMCGIGNIYSDEILFQSDIHPKKKLQDISKNKLGDLFDNMKEILKTCIDKGADYSEYPDHFIIPNRQEGKDCPNGKGKIQKLKVSGRTSYYCPEVQKK